MARKRILSNWIDLPGFGAVQAMSAEFWVLANSPALAQGAMAASSSIAGPSGLPLNLAPRITGTVPHLTAGPSFCFAHTRDHNLRMASTIFSTRPLPG